MSKIRFTLKAFAFLVFTLACASATNAQATRTWVSGTGDDANPCSRTAPCKTIAGATSKTASGGEINALDAGGFGAVTITKALTIDGGGGFVASILASGSAGINVNAGASDVVIIRNLKINGIRQTISPGTQGISFNSGKTLIVENCFIFGFPNDGIHIALSVANSQAVSVKDTLIENCGGAGVGGSNSAGGVNVSLDNVKVSFCTAGLSVSTNSRANARNSSFNNNTGSGVEVLGGAAGVDLDTCGIQGNASGIAIAASTTRIANCRITNNTNGINFVGGTLVTYGDNKIDGNTNDTLGGSIPAPINRR